MKKKIIFGWILAILTTLGASVYQRMTGPTHSKKETIVLNDGDYTVKLPRSGGEVDQRVLLQGIYSKMDTVLVEASILWRHYPTSEAFKELKMTNSELGLVGFLPVQPAAGKLEYFIRVSEGKNLSSISYFKESPLIIRFKQDVPMGILIPHILFMFVAMLLGAFAFFCAFVNLNHLYPKYLLASLISLIIGGFIFGPLVQKFAFNAYWTGFPFGMDLTDNKTLIALLFMLGATIAAFKTRYGRIATLIAVHVLFIIFSIPHSLRGSELNYKTEKVVTGD